jgi:hypothetical protein
MQINSTTRAGMIHLIKITIINSTNKGARIITNREILGTNMITKEIHTTNRTISNLEVAQITLDKDKKDLLMIDLKCKSTRQNNLENLIEMILDSIIEILNQSTTLSGIIIPIRINVEAALDLRRNSLGKTTIKRTTINPEIWNQLDLVLK